MGKMDKRIKLNDYKSVFSSEEFKALRIFYNAGYDLIKRVEEGDLILARITKENENNIIRELDGVLIPEEWFKCIKKETEYYFEDIFGG